MANNPILTIAIPTFNRKDSLEKTIESLPTNRNAEDVEILVVDNCSTDGTWEWLCDRRDGLALTIKRNFVNIGIEGNIIQALLNSKGSYIWLLSDHMCVDAREAQTFINHLMEGLEFTFCYSRISEYYNVLPETYTPFKLKDISQYSLGELIFYVGNISAFVVKKNFLYNCFRSVIRFSFFSYPHLGVFAHANENDSFVEIPPVSSFIVDRKQSKRISYDRFRSRFIGFVKAVNEIRRLNTNLKNINQALNTRRMLGALAADSISNLCFERINPIKPSEFAFCLRYYPGFIKFFLLACLALSVLPCNVRLPTSKLIFKTLIPKYYNKVKADSGRFVTNEIILE